MVSPAERGVDGGVGGHEEEEGQEAGGEQPRPVHVHPSPEKGYTSKSGFIISTKTTF